MQPQEDGAAPADIIFITALSGTGKTTTGDYLSEYCGVHHVDGDNILHHGVSDRPEWEQAAGDITRALFEHWMRGEPCPEELWHPYLAILCAQIKEAQQHHRRIVVTWVVYRRDVRDFLRQRLGPGLRFLRLDCETDVLVRGAHARLEEGLQMSGMTTEDGWRSEDPAMQNCGGQKRYGGFSLESYKQMQLDNALNGMQHFDTDELSDSQVVDVSTRDTAAFLRVSTALGLVPTTTDIDIAALKAISTSKMRRLFAEMPAPSALPMAKHAKPKNAPAEQWERLLLRERQLEKALIVRPEAKLRGPTIQQLLQSCKRPRAFVRVRPLLPNEVESGAQPLEGLRPSTCLSQHRNSGEAQGQPSGDAPPSEDGVIALAGSSQPIGGFDGLFGVEAHNAAVFAAAVAPVLPLVLEGGRVSVFCYGHTGTGKTHSMLGCEGQPGIFTLTAQRLLEQINSINADGPSQDGPLSLQVRFVVIGPRYALHQPVCPH